MPLHLSDAQLRQVRELQDVLAKPLQLHAFEDWLRAVHDAATAVFDVERSLMVVPGHDGDLTIDSPNIESDILTGLAEAIRGTGPGVNQYGDPMLNLAMRRLAMSGTEIWTSEVAERLTRISLHQMPRFYPEVVRPGKLEGMLVMAHSLEEGRALFQVFPRDPAGTRFGAHGIEAFRLILPAFRAGTRALRLFDGRQRGLRRSLDLLEEGVALYRGGVLCYRNLSLRRLLDHEEFDDRIMAEAARCAERLSTALQAPRPLRRVRNASGVVSTPTNRYRFAASHLEDGSGGRPMVVMVVVRPAVPPLPGPRELRDRYSLTPRQAEITPLLARGRSNAEIADLLQISPHTARHHAQQVLEKVGCGTRKALAIQLLADREF